MLSYSFSSLIWQRDAHKGRSSKCLSKQFHKIAFIDTSMKASQTINNQSKHTWLKQLSMRGFAAIQEVLTGDRQCDPSKNKSVDVFVRKWAKLWEDDDSVRSFHQEEVKETTHCYDKGNKQ